MAGELLSEEADAALSELVLPDELLLPPHAANKAVSVISAKMMLSFVSEFERRIISFLIGLSQN